MKKLAIFLSIALIAIAPTVYASNWQPAGDKWIEKWWALDLVINTGGFDKSAETDYLAEGTVDLTTNEAVYTNQSVSTRFGAGLTGRTPVRLPAENGGILTWSVVNLNINSTNNMYQSHDIPDNAPGHLKDNITWHGIILILSPDKRTTTIHPAHDDHAEIWLNGKKVYNNPNWTRGATTAPQPTEVDLYEGENFLHLKVGEGGGGDYVNLRFSEGDEDLRIAPTMNDKFLDVLTPVEPKGKVTTTWADIKRK